MNSKFGLSSGRRPLALSTPLILISFLMGAVVCLASAEDLDCRTAFWKAYESEELQAAFTEKPEIAESWRSYQSLVAQSPFIKMFLKPRVVAEIYADLEMSQRTKVLSALVDSLLFRVAHQGALSFKDAKQAIREDLIIYMKDRLPKEEAHARTDAFLRSSGLKSRLIPALGEMELEDLHRLVYGGDLDQVTPESLLGQYIARTGAKTLKRKFRSIPRNVDPNADQWGPEKLAVAVSEQSFGEFKKLFSEIEFLFHAHEPGQGTLMMAHEGEVFKYANRRGFLRSQGEGTILPLVMLNSREGQRLRQYLDLGNTPQNAAHNPPWNFQNANGEAYCARGGYISCTFWVGDMPIGDKRVKNYTFPGNVDNHAGNALGAGPQTKELTPYESTSALVKRVWKVPGNQQFSEILGLGDRNIAGEFANPGYFATTLTGVASNERVPIVFILTQDHTQSLDPNFEPHISAY